MCKRWGGCDEARRFLARIEFLYRRFAPFEQFLQQHDTAHFLLDNKTPRCNRSNPFDLVIADQGDGPPYPYGHGFVLISLRKREMSRCDIAGIVNRCTLFVWAHSGIDD